MSYTGAMWLGWYKKCNEYEYLKGMRDAEEKQQSILFSGSLHQPPYIPLFHCLFLPFLHKTSYSTIWSAVKNH